MESLEAGTTSESEYQVFLNFRGPDTRNEFTDFLYHSLTDAGIRVFRDSENLHVGERIDGALQRAIDNSRIYIPIFSPTYASSKWCLHELTQIMVNAKSNGNKEILPIFFKVEPKDVKMKAGLFHDAILNLKRENNANTEQVYSWRKALTEVAAIKGREVKTGDSQAKLIKLVVEEVVIKLKIKQKSVTEYLTGIDDRVIEVRNSLDIDSGGVRLIQIHGMGGIGKTTLAKVVFNELSTHFGNCCYFLEDVREKSSTTDGLVELQRKLLSKIGNAIGIGSINETYYGMKRIEETLRNKKVFIVLDDVDKSEQVEKLVGKGDLCSGSRVLITTRNKDVLQITRLEYKMLSYEMEVMSSDHALQLFSRHAFNKESPSDDRYDISKGIVSATGRLPLTIEVIGSFLRNKTQGLWQEILDKLIKTLPMGVFEKLKISYDALTFEQQQIFLDVACLFIGKDWTKSIHMWSDCDFFPVSGIAVLESMSLIKIVKDNRFWMHDQLIDLGREIVRQENRNNPEKRSRLWIKKEVIDAIKTNKMKNVEAMELESHGPILCLKSEEIERFEKLRFLRLRGGIFIGDLINCFPKLRWINWTAFGYKFELTNMCLKSVVVLKLSGIAVIDDLKLRQLIKEARNLKVLSLGGCDITRIPDLSGCSTLERLSFGCCKGLRRIDGSIVKLKHLIELRLDHCPLLGLPEEIGDLQNLEHFSLTGCCLVEEPSVSLFKCKSLRELRLSSLGSGDRLGLRLNANLKSQLPYEIGLFSQLQKLVLREVYEIRELPTLPISLTHLNVSSMSLEVVPDLSNLTNLVKLDLRDGSEYGKRDIILTGELRWIGRLSKLEKLTLYLLHVPALIELASVPRLSRLLLSGLNLQPCTQVPSSPSSLLELSLEKFNSITLLSSNLKNLSLVSLSDSQMEEIILDGLQLPNLTDLDVYRCGPLQRFMLSDMKMLKEVAIWDCPKLDEIHITGVLESLEFLHIHECESFRRFMYVDIHGESSHLSSLILESKVFNKLRHLWLQSCHKILNIQVVGMSEWLEELTISGHLLQSLSGLSNLKNLKSLKINLGLELLIVEGLDKLKFLNKLTLRDCGSLESPIDVSTTELPNDCFLSIRHCPKLLGVKQEFKGSIQSFKRYKEEESVPAASTDPLMVWHPPMVSRAESSAQAQMRVLGKMEEPQEPSSHRTCTCFGGLFCFKDH